MTVDFRSDTLTLPSKEMKEAMLNAPLGDDVFVEDPSIIALEKYGAKLFGKEAALYCPSGTMTNQIAINIHSYPGGEVICHSEAHIYRYEGGGIAKNTGSSVRLIQGNSGRIDPSLLEGEINHDDVHLPVTSLVCIEDTANRGGGCYYNFEDIKEIRTITKRHNLPLHVDGARLFNALVETGISPKDYGEQFDSISICLSKGLGAPVGSLLIGDKDFIKQARRVRKVLGGGMRQAGIIAAGGLYALQNNIERLKEDHMNASELGEVLSKLPWVESVVPVYTNIVIINTISKAEDWLEKLDAQGIKCVKFGPKKIRFVTHLDNTKEQIEYVKSELMKIQ